MEEHRRRPVSTGSARRSSSLSPHSLVIRFPELRVAVTDASCAIGRAMVEAFRSVDAVVDFAMRQGNEGSSLAQLTGSRFHPVNDDYSFVSFVRRINSDRGGVDLLVSCGEDAAYRETAFLSGIAADPARIVRCMPYGSPGHIAVAVPVLDLDPAIDPRCASSLALLFASPAMSGSGSLQVSQISCG